MTTQLVRSPERTDWVKHRDLLAAAPDGPAGLRACLGLGLMVESQDSESWLSCGENTLFLPDRSVRWAAVTDVPTTSFRAVTGFGHNRGVVHWASIRPTTVRYGMPFLAYRTAGTEFNLRASVENVEPRVARAFNALSWSMTSTAFMFRGPWMAHRRKFYDAIGATPDRDPAAKLLLFGDDVYTSVAPAAAWMPRAYLAFPEKMAGDLFVRSTRVARGCPALYSEEFTRRFVTDAVSGESYLARYDGDVVKMASHVDRGIRVTEVHLRGDGGRHEVVHFQTDGTNFRVGTRSRFHAGQTLAVWGPPIPAGLGNRHPAGQWATLHREWGWSFERHVELWFNRQGFRLKPGYVHMDARLAAAAALGSAVDRELLWDVGPAQNYFREDCDTFVFPTLCLGRWWELRGALPGSVEFDLRPGVAEFIDKDRYMVEAGRA